MSFAGTAQTACATDLGDGGPGNVCFPGAATNKLDPDLTYVLGLICGM